MATKTNLRKRESNNGAAAANAIEKIVLPEIQVREAQITVQGITPLIVHNWSEKAKRMMRDKQQGKARAKNPPKNPQEEFESSLYVVKGCEKWPLDKPGRYFYPAKGFKSAIVTGCRFASSDIPMTRARGLLFIPEDPILEFSELIQREDMVRLETGVADIRYRGEFTDWSCALHVQYNAGLITLEQLVNMVNLGGFHTGIGEWRPGSKKAYNGEYGRFRVAGDVQELS